MDRRVVRCGDYRFRVTSWGAGAPHAVVLPGLSADARSLAPQIRLLRRLYPSVHVIDLPGSVLRPALLVRDARFATIAGYVARVLDEMGIASAVLLGHSLGGGLSLHLALARPDKVDALILLAPAALGRSLHWVYKLYCVPLVGRALLRPQPNVSKPFVRRFLVGTGRRTDDHFLSMLVRHGSSSRDRALTARAIVWANQPPWWRRLALMPVPGGEQMAFSIGSRVRDLAGVPTLVLWGNEDRVISSRDAAIIRAAHPRAEVHIASGVGHMVPLEAAAWANGHIRRFSLDLHEELAAAA